MARKKILDSETRVFVSRSLVRLSDVKDTRGRTLFRGSFNQESNTLGILVFLDMFPGDTFPHLCRYVFTRIDGSTEKADGVHSPAEDLHLQLV